ncbi:MAG: RidA family protein [Thermoanaerobaculia bacterium]|nr:RidA family protein [Thermoanaerobaculia bacterium]
MSLLQVIQPAGWAAPKGYSNGIAGPTGSRPLAVAGQIGWDAEQNMVDGGFAAQFEQALRNVVDVTSAAGGTAEDIASLTIYVTDCHAYLDQISAVGTGYRRAMGHHYPAMALVEVAALLEPEALVEIQALAFLPATEP